MGCKSLLPAQISELSLESSELQENPQNPEQLVLVALIRNHAAYAQQWPHLSLTLKDANEQIIARRILTPKEYLAFDPTLQANLKAGISENSEQSIQVIFALKEYKVTGYQVNLFYPSV